MDACVWHSLRVDVMRDVLAEGLAFTEELEARKLAISTGKAADPRARKRKRRIKEPWEAT